ncbi:MAG: hypothetical protein VXZ35_04930, partial [Pseudomonadota bacterium]|nr:hypothetical protein [Pseudomonadota bacterium]
MGETKKKKAQSLKLSLPPITTGALALTALAIAISAYILYGAWVSDAGTEQTAQLSKTQANKRAAA